MTKSDDDKAAEILAFAVFTVSLVAERGERQGLDGHEITLALAQALALAIEMTGRPGHKKSIAADMAAIVAAFPPIMHDAPSARWNLDHAAQAAADPRRLYHPALQRHPA